MLPFRGALLLGTPGSWVVTLLNADPTAGKLAFGLHAERDDICVLISHVADRAATEIQERTTPGRRLHACRRADPSDVCSQFDVPCCSPPSRHLRARFGPSFCSISLGSN